MNLQKTVHVATIISLIVLAITTVIITPIGFDLEAPAIVWVIPIMAMLLTIIDQR